MTWYVEAYHGRDRVVHGLFTSCSGAMDFAAQIIQAIERNSKLYDNVFVGQGEGIHDRIEFGFGKWECNK